MRCIGILLLLLAASFAAAAAEKKEKVTVSVKGEKTIATTDKSFVCACIDFWPADKCNYGWCPWGQSSALNLDLENPILHNALEAFSQKNMPPLRARIGGSLQDQVIYKVGSRSERPPCPKFRLKEFGEFGFGDGCLDTCRWDKLNDYFSKTGVILTFGLNAMLGRKMAPPSKQHPKEAALYAGHWDSSNAEAFMNYTISKGFNVDSWEFGNELSGDGVGWKVDAYTYGKDLIALRKIVDRLYRDKPKKPDIVSPGGFYHKEWFAKMLKVSGPRVVDTVSIHIYDLGSGDSPDLFRKLQDPDHLMKTEPFEDLQRTIKKHGPWTSAWVGESGGAFNSGGPESHTFVNSFWYLNQLGMSSTFNTKVHCRQTLVGGNYQLLDRHTFVPNPDYYSALLWHRLMGPGVLKATHSGSKYLRTYAHCRRNNDGVTVLFLNLSNSTSFEISVAEAKPEAEREDYYLTPKDGNLRSQVMLLNGNPLELTKSGQIPETKPVLTKASVPIRIVPSSIAFVSFKDFDASACLKN